MNKSIFKRITELKKTIESSYLELGQLLRQVRDQALFAQKGFPTFPAYLKSEFEGVYYKTALIYIEIAERTAKLDVAKEIKSSRLPPSRIKSILRLDNKELVRETLKNPPPANVLKNPYKKINFTNPELIGRFYRLKIRLNAATYDDVLKILLDTFEIYNSHLVMKEQ